MPQGILKIYNKASGKKVVLAAAGEINEDRTYVLPGTGGTLTTEESAKKIVDDAILANQEANPIPSGVDETAVLNMFANAPTKTGLLDTDKFTLIEAGIGEGSVSVIKDISYSDFKVDLKTYLDTVYTGGGSGTGTVSGTSVAPILTGPNTANETQTVVIDIANYDPSSIYTFEVTGGTFSRISGEITWILPQVSDSMAHKLTVSVINPGKTITSVFHGINVFNINATADSIILYEGSTINEFTGLKNITVTNSRLIATADTTLTIVNNKICATLDMENSDIMVVEGSIYKILSIQMDPNGNDNSSVINAVSLATSNITPEGTIIYDSQSTAAAYLAFDRNNAAGWRTNKKSGLWIGFNFNSPKIINKYRIAGNTVSATVAPKDWIFQASNDGIDWYDLATVTGQTTWGASELRTFTCSNSTVYKQYRVYITAGNGSADIGLASLELIEAVNFVSETLPILPQFISSAKLLTKFADSNIINQDNYETDFTGISNLNVVYEQYNLVSVKTTLIALPTIMLLIGDIVVIGNSTDGIKSIEVTTLNYANSVLDISPLGFTVIPTYGYRKDSSIKVYLGNEAYIAADRIDVILTSPLYDTDGINNPSTTSKVPVLPLNSTAAFSSTDYYGTSNAGAAFDNDLITPVLLTDVVSTSGPHIGYDFGVNAKIMINKYSITTTPEWGVPTDWVLEGSNDKVAWVIAHTVTGATWLNRGTMKTNEYTFDSATLPGYRYYRVRVTKITGSWCGIYGVKFIEAQPNVKMQIKATYSDIITNISARTIKFRAKLNRIGDTISKISATLQKL